MDARFTNVHKQLVGKELKMGAPALAQVKNGEIVGEALEEENQEVNRRIQRNQKSLELIGKLKEIGQTSKAEEFNLESDEGLSECSEFIEKFLANQKEQEQLQKIRESKARIKAQQEETKKKKELYELEQSERLEQEKREKEEKEEARRKKIEEEIRATEAKREKEREQKRIDDEKFQEQLKKQKVQIFLSIEKKQQGFDPEKVDWKKLYEEYLENEKKKERREIDHMRKIEEEYRSSLKKMADERKEKDYLHRGFSDDSYDERLKRKREAEEKAKNARKIMEIEQTIHYEESIEKSKSYLEFSKKFYEIRHPKELLKARQKEKKEKISELIEKWKEKRPVRFDEKKKEEREKVLEALSSKERVRQIIEEKRQEAKARMPNYLEELKKTHKGKRVTPAKFSIVSGSTSVKTFDNRESSKENNGRNEKERDSHSHLRRMSGTQTTKSIPAIKISHGYQKLILKEEGGGEWEKTLRKDSLSQLEKFEKILIESEKLEEKAKRKEFLEKVSDNIFDEKTGKKLEQPFEKYEYSSDQMYVGSIRAKLALLNEIH